MPKYKFARYTIQGTRYVFNNLKVARKWGKKIGVRVIDRYAWKLKSRV